MLVVQNIHYYTKDMDRAVQFYTAVLGMSVTYNSPYWTAMNCSGVSVALHLHEGPNSFPKIDSLSGDHIHAGGAVLTLGVANIRDWKLRFESFAVRHSEIRDEPFGLLVEFLDPDGNVLNLMQPKAY